MIPLKNNPDCYIVNVPGEATDVTIEKYRQYFHLNWKLPPQHGLTCSGGRALFYNEFGGKRKYPENLIVLGEITADHIGFDTMDSLGLTEQETYESVEASGVCFKNTYGESEPPQRTYDALGRDLNIEWHNSQQKLTQKSILIKKV